MADSILGRSAQNILGEPPKCSLGELPPQRTRYDFLTLIIRTPQAQLGWRKTILKSRGHSPNRLFKCTHARQPARPPVRLPVQAVRPSVRPSLLQSVPPPAQAPSAHPPPPARSPFGRAVVSQDCFSFFVGGRSLKVDHIWNLNPSWQFCIFDFELISIIFWSWEHWGACKNHSLSKYVHAPKALYPLGYRSL